LITRKGIIASFMVATLVAPSVGAASTPPLGGSNCSACNQYTEQVPTSRGSNTVGTKAKKVSKAAQVPLSQEAEKAIVTAPKPTQKKLNEIMTSTKFGASAKLPLTRTPRIGRIDSSLGRSLQAAIVSPGSGSAARLVILLIAIVGATVVVGVMAIRRQRV
jgi:hypothetical protein